MELFAEGALSAEQQIVFYPFFSLKFHSFNIPSLLFMLKIYDTERKKQAVHFKIHAKELFAGLADSGGVSNKRRLFHSQFDLVSRLKNNCSLFDLDNFTVNSSDGNNLVSLFKGLSEFFLFFIFSGLRPDKEKVKNDQNQEKGQQGHPSAVFSRFGL